MWSAIALTNKYFRSLPTMQHHSTNRLRKWNVAHAAVLGIKETKRENHLLKSYEQQRIELENGGVDIMTVLVELLIKLSGQPHLVAQAAVELKISGPTFRQWCDDMDINIGEFI